jgi:Nickel responsive protein SCO4226-like
MRRSCAALITERYKQMALFMDVHNIEGGVSEADAAGAHQADLATQAPYGVSYLRYWVDEEAANAVHRQAHGLVADEIYPVSEHA